MSEPTPSSPQPSAPSGSPPTGTAASGDGGTILGRASAGDGVGAPRTEPAKVGDNGAPDWRNQFAGEDAAMLERFSKYKSPSDVGKALIEAQTKLSQRAAIPQLTDKSTPEQIAEYRKAIGAPDIAEGTPAEKMMEAYGIKMPDGYQATEVEKGMLSEFAKLANSKHMPASAVKEATDFFFKSQAANQQALTRLDSERQKTWQGELEKSFGAEFKPMIAAGESYLKSKFGENPEAKNELLNARLPGGGRLGDHPGFIQMVVDLAMQNGFTDRIEANSLESGGKSLEAQQNEIEALRTKDIAKYNLPETQARLDKLIELRLARGEIDEMGNPVRKRRTAA